MQAELIEMDAKDLWDILSMEGNNARVPPEYTPHRRGLCNVAIVMQISSPGNFSSHGILTLGNGWNIYVKTLLEPSAKECISTCLYFRIHCVKQFALLVHVHRCWACVWKWQVDLYVCWVYMSHRDCSGARCRGVESQLQDALWLAVSSFSFGRILFPFGLEKFRFCATWKCCLRPKTFFFLLSLFWSVVSPKLAH